MRAFSAAADGVASDIRKIYDDAIKPLHDLATSERFASLRSFMAGLDAALTPFTNVLARRVSVAVSVDNSNAVAARHGRNPPSSSISFNSRSASLK